MTVSVRYIVDDIDAAVAFYTEYLGFSGAVETAPGSGFALLQREDLRLLLNAPGAGGAGRAAPEGVLPSPGGWNRFQLATRDLDTAVERLRAAGVDMRSPVVNGRGGRQVVIEDPSGNPVELFEPAQS